MAKLSTMVQRRDTSVWLVERGPVSRHGCQDTPAAAVCSWSNVSPCTHDGRQPGCETTHALIKAHVRVTPVVDMNGADLGLADFPLTLKLELFQHAGSFKTRGAFTNLLTRAIPGAGVVASGTRRRRCVRGDAARRGGPASRAEPCPRPRR